MFYNNIIVWFNSVLTVKRAKDALGVLWSNDLSFDLVVREVHMPEMNGFQLKQEISKEIKVPFCL